MEFYHFPYLKFSLQPVTVVEAAIASLLAAGAGTVFAVWRAATLRPAQAMRPEPPPRYRETWVEKLGLKRWLSQPTRMIIRHIQRRALKSALTVLGIALACGIILTGLFQRDTVGYMVHVQYGMAQREDLSVTFTDPTAYRARFDLRAPAGRAARGGVPRRCRCGCATGISLPHRHPRHRTGRRHPAPARCRPASGRAAAPTASCSPITSASCSMCVPATASSWRCSKATGRCAKPRWSVW